MKNWKTIEQLERITEENNKITIAKILNVETYNHNFSSLTCEYLKFSKNTEHIEIILPANTHDASSDKRNKYELKFNYDIDLNEVFTNLKKISISNNTWIYYFFNYCSYRIIASPNSGRQYEYIICLGNNTIEEIKFYEYSNNGFCLPSIHILSDTNEDIVAKQKYIKKYNTNPFIQCEENTFKETIYCLPELKIITVNYTNAGHLDSLNNFIEKCKSKNKSKNFKKLVLNKIEMYTSYNNNHVKNLNDLREICKKFLIELEIKEIIYK